MKQAVLLKYIPWGGVLFLLLLLPHFKTAYMDAIPLMDFAFNVGRIISFLLAATLFVVGNRRLDASMGLLLLFVAWLFFSTLINANSLVPLATTYGLALGAYVLVCYYARSPRMLVSVVFCLGEFLVYANLAAMILFPDGLYVSKLLGFYHNWILGYKNQFLPFFLCFAVVAYLKAVFTGKGFRSLILVAAMLVSLVLARSATSLIVMALFAAGALLARTSLRQVYSPYFLAFVVCGIVGMVVLPGEQGFLNDAVAGAMGRDVTYSGRTVIWASVLNAAAEKPLVGWGVMSEEEHIRLLDYADASSAHDYYLEVLLSGGLIGVVLFALFVISLLKSIKRYEGTQVSKIFALMLFSLGIAFITEAYVSPVLFALLAMAANTEQFALEAENACIQGCRGCGGSVNGLKLKVCSGRRRRLAM